MNKVIISKKRTLEAAKEYYGKKVAVLNFADAITPGGAVLYGASTQEEAICRCSTLYESISKDIMLKQFYHPHRKLDSFYNDDIIYTPDVVVFKEDTSEAKVLPREEWYLGDVITCAAPYLGAFGCGAFANPPEIVAKVFKEALVEYEQYFDTVEFAAYCAEEETRNYKVFKEILENT